MTKTNRNIMIGAVSGTLVVGTTLAIVLPLTLGKDDQATSPYKGQQLALDDATLAKFKTEFGLSDVSQVRFDEENAYVYGTISMPAPAANPSRNAIFALKDIASQTIDVEVEITVVRATNQASITNVLGGISDESQISELKSQAPRTISSSFDINQIITKATTPVVPSSWSPALPSGPYYLISENVFTTNKTQAAGYSAGTNPSPASIPAPTSEGQTITIGTTVYTATAGVYSPVSPVNAQYKIGEHYYSTIDKALAAAGFVPSVAGSFHNDAVYSANEPTEPDDTWTQGGGFYKDDAWSAEQPTFENYTLVQYDDGAESGTPTERPTGTDVADDATSWYVNPADQSAHASNIDSSWTQVSDGWHKDDAYSATQPTRRTAGYVETADGSYHNGNVYYPTKQDAINAASTIETVTTIQYTSGGIDIDEAHVDTTTSIAYPQLPSVVYSKADGTYTTVISEAVGYVAPVNPAAVQLPTPSEGQTITINGVVYTFGTPSSNAERAENLYLI